MKKIMMLLAMFVSSVCWGADMKDWTMLVYLNGHNNLDSFGATNVSQMQTADNPNVNIVVQWASLSYGKTRRVLVTHNNAQVLSELAPVDMGDYNSLIDFIKWGVANYPAKHYLVDVWNHGNGWKLEALDRGTVRGGFHALDISYDDTTGHSINSQQLGLAMKAAAQVMGHNVDVYGSDACLMAQVEVDYELAGSVDYVVGSEETEPGDGWPYDKLLAQWGDSPAEVAKTLATVYVANYPGQDVTMSAADMSQFPALVGSLKQLKGLMLKNLSEAKTAVGQAQSFTFSDYVDLGGFIQNFQPSAKESKAVSAALSSFIMLSQGDGAHKGASGLDLWIPVSDDSSDLAKYQGLGFDKETGWSDMLQKLWK